MQKSKIKVSTEALLAAVRAKREKLVADHEKALAKQSAAEAAYRVKVVAALRKRADQIEGGGDLPERAYHNRFEVKLANLGDAPTAPSLRTEPLDRLIRTLEIAAEPTILISADDAAAYL